MKGKILLAAVAIALLSAGAALATGIIATKHDLSLAANTISNTGQNSEICVYCHTPHSANTAFTGAPLWNKATPSGSYTLYGTTIAGSTALAQTETTFGVTRACLSCHDGVNAINSVVNQAGTGGYTSGGVNIAWTKPVTAATVPLVMPAGAALLAADLSNDHPVNFTYDTSKSLTLRAPSAPTSATIVKVLTATTVSGTSGTSKVQCSSCHDPHTNVSGGSLFLRISNSGSALCFACHVK